MKNRMFSQTSVRSAIQLVVDDFRTRNQILTVIQVGACNGSIDNDPLHEIIKDQSNVCAHLIEAVSWLYNDLIHIMKPYADHVKCYNLTIGGKDEIRNFYSVSEQFGVEHPDAESWLKYQIGSLIDKHLRVWIPEKYIQVNEVQCISPGMFLNIADVKPQDLNVLITDTEGFDGEIVTEFLTITRPEMIVYEHKVMLGHENNTMLMLLEKYSYEYKKIGEDILAIRSS